MLIKGEVYACDACVQGHQTSNCEHADRPLQHITPTAREYVKSAAKRRIGRVFTFTWPFPASEVFVTGTFDDWSKSHKLKKDGEVFTANVVLDDETKNIYYKFVVDGNWMLNPNDPQELDAAKNRNNVLTPARTSTLISYPQITKKTSLGVDFGFVKDSAINYGGNSSSSLAEEGIDKAEIWTRSPADEKRQPEEGFSASGRIFPDNREIPSDFMGGRSYSLSPTGAVDGEHSDEDSDVYQNFPPNEPSALDDPFFGVNFDDKVHSIDSLFPPGPLDHYAFPIATRSDQTGSLEPTSNFNLESPLRIKTELPSDYFPEPSNSELHAETDEGLASLWRAQGRSPVPHLKAADSAIKSQTTMNNSNTVEAGNDENDELPDNYDQYKLNIPITPNYEGFKVHVRYLNPDMDPLYNWLVSRIAHQQEIRYKKLLELRVRHAQALTNRNCSAGRQCVALGGSAILLREKSTMKEAESKILDDPDFSNDAELELTDESFPMGVPLPPTRALPAQFECQLCFRVKKVQKPSDWTKHVHEDVEPFTCTFDKCAEPKSFKRKADWVRHENERHRQLEWWICQKDDCCHTCYRKDNFIQHLVREHKLPEPKQKTKAAIKKAHLTEPAWMMLEQCHHETLKKPQDEPCKFCGKVFNTWKKLTTHLSKHMEHIALPILPLIESVAADEQIRTPFPDSPPLPDTPDHPTSKFNSFHPMEVDPREYDVNTSDVNHGAAREESIRVSPLIAGLFSIPPRDNAAVTIKGPDGTPLDMRDTPGELHSREVSPQFEDRDWDLKSIASLNTFRDSALGSSIPSNMSNSEIQALPRTAQEEVLIILNSDAKLRSLFEEAARRINKTRFVRNIRVLFLLFHKDLQESAVDLREKDATRIIEKHAQWLASRLFDVCDPNNKSNNKVLAAHLNQHIDKRPLLENYLAAMTNSRLKITHSETLNDGTAHLMNQTKLSLEHETKTELEESTSSEEDEDEASNNGDIQIDYSQFPNLDHIRKFIIGGVAFENLRRNTSNFIHPKESLKPSNSQAQAQAFSYQPDSTSDPAMKKHSIHNELASDSVGRESESSAGTTDITMPDIDSESDDDMSELSSDPDLYNGVLEDRILNPKAYFEKLRTMEQDVFDILGLSPNGVSSGLADDDFLLQGLKPRFSPSSHNTLNTKQVVSLIKFTMSDKLLQLLECCNHIARICTSLIKLQEIGYCTSQISLIVKDGDRSQVAKMLSIDVEMVESLNSGFLGLLDSVVSIVSSMQIGAASHDTVNSLIEEQDAQLGVTALCSQALTSMGFLPHLLLNDVRHVAWDCTVQTLELAVLSYAGAHTQRFDLELFKEEKLAFELPRRFVYCDLTLRQLSSWSCSRSISFRRRQFQCLDKFLGGAQPWVFHQDFSNGGDERLYLSTKVDTLTDIWGPSWKIVRDSEPGCIQQLDIGSGAIIPWSTSDNLGEQDIQLQASEVYCHWIPFKDWNLEDIEANQSSLQRKHFQDTATLLIGATNDFGLIVNPKCTSSIERLFSIKTKLDQQGALRAPNTFRAQRYVDSHAIQVQGSAMGFFTAGDTITYKRRNGQTMKHALVERWRHNLRNPMDLEVFSGVEISLCTRNARRRRLLHLLGSQTMYNYLRGITFVWVSEACEYAYFKALRSPKLFRKFWKAHPDYQANVGDAISKCLDALEETGIDEDSRELRGLWVESFDTEGDSDGESDDGSDDDQKPNNSSPPTAIAKSTPNFFEEWIVTLFRSEHTWTGFLVDSEESLTMAVLGMACLDFDHNGYGRRCAAPQQLATNQTAETKGYPVLQTSLQLNTTLLKNSKLKQETVSSGQTTIWNAKEVKPGTSFPLGDHGSLRVLTPASRTCAVIMEWHGVKSEIAREIKNVAVNEKLLGRNNERHHREYIRGKWEEKPLPVLVLSKSNKILFTKC